MYYPVVKELSLRLKYEWFIYYKFVRDSWELSKNIYYCCENENRTKSILTILMVRNIKGCNMMGFLSKRVFANIIEHSLLGPNCFLGKEGMK